MKVIHITSWLSGRGGGIPPVIWGLSHEMGLAGVDCTVAGLSDRLSETPNGNSHASILVGKGRGAFGYSPDLGRKVSSSMGRDSIIHSHGLWMHPGVIARKMAAAAGAPLVISAHGMLDPWAVRNSALKKRVAGWLFENRNLRQATCLHALCEAEARSYRDFGLRNPICIIPNGIDLPGASRQEATVNGEAQKVESALPPGKVAGRKTLLYLGRIHPKKGLVNLIRAWATIQPSGWALAIAGWDQGGHETELKRLCTELGVPHIDSRAADSNLTIPGLVRFLGPQFGAAKTACYENCDAFILPSVSEGLPMVVLEAWAHGKPVLMTPQCNLPEGFAADAAIRIETGVESIAKGLDSLLSTSSSRIENLGKNGRTLVTTRFNWARCAREMVDVYRWLLEGGTKPDVLV